MPLHRHFPVFLSGSGRCVFLVELSLQRRKNNAGWRIDYFLVSESLKPALRKAEILDRRVRQAITVR